MSRTNFSNLLEAAVPQNKKLAVLICGILGFVLPAIYALFAGIPIPRVQDEFAYLLGADTFASGRWTNLTPLCWQSFESPHLLMLPSYMSKYPPMQSLFLAAGDLLFGHPIFGVWLSCGLAAAAVCWMMQGWITRKWAFAGTLMMIFFLGINSYWAQSYWGGMVAVLAGGLLFGGFRRLYRKVNAFDTAMMTLGGAILINARPFEGFITIFFVLAVLAIRLLRNRRAGFPEILKKVVLPGALLSAATLGMMGLYNFEVTGSALKMPYSIHQQQYFSTPLFIFQNPQPRPPMGHARLQRLSEYYTEPRFTKTFFLITELPDNNYLRPVYFFVCLMIFMPNFYLYSAFTLLLFVALPFLLKKKKSLLLIFGAIAFTFAVMSLATFWDQYHYSAHLAGGFFLLGIETLRYFIFLCKKQKKIIYDRLAFFVVLVLVLVSFIRLSTGEDDVIRFYGNKPDQPIDFSQPLISLDKAQQKSVHLREQIARMLSETGEKYLLVVKYDPKYSFDDEIVYNLADLDNLPVVWAHYLEPEKNKALLDYYKDRKVLLIKISQSSLTIEPMPLN
jgi:hypothetical protein